MHVRFFTSANTAVGSPLDPGADIGASVKQRRDARPFGLPVWSVLLGLVVAAILLRFVLLGEFPDIEADEGLWTQSSKNRALFGDWFMDGQTHLFLSPLFHALNILLFEVAGPSFATARMISAAAGAASTWLSFVLVRRLTGRIDVALVTAALLAVSETAVMLSRRALIEPLQVLLLLATAALLAASRRQSAVAAAVVFGLAMVTKVNSIFFLAPLAVLCAPWSAHAPSWRRAGIRIAIVTSVALVVAGGVYAALHAMDPAAFRAAFLFELDGVHFEALSDPIVRVGRFGLDPVYAGRSLLELLRAEPFLVVLASIGVAIGVLSRPPGTLFFGAWLAVGMTYLLCQMYQPLRYFYLVFPPIVFFAALALVSLRFEGTSATPPVRQFRIVLLAMILAFEIAYVVMNAAANHGRRLGAVDEWAQTALEADERVLASALLCTDLPQRCYAFYRLVDGPQELDAVVDSHAIDVVIVDGFEWPETYRRAIAERYEVMRTWPHATAYRVATR